MPLLTGRARSHASPHDGACPLTTRSTDTTPRLAGTGEPRHNWLEGLMKYPLLYRFIDEVRTLDWAVRVMVCGRYLMSFEDDEWWAEGVDPGGFAVPGSVPPLAATNLRST